MELVIEGVLGIRFTTIELRCITCVLTSAILFDEASELKLPIRFWWIFCWAMASFFAFSWASFITRRLLGDVMFCGDFRGERDCGAVDPEASEA